MISLRQALVVTAVASLAAPAGVRAQEQPLGFVEQAFGRFDRDTLAPVAPSLALAEPHARPVFSPDGKRLALGLSAPGTGGGRIGIWIVDPARMTVLHAVATGIAAEAVVYPGVVAGLLQNGALVIVDPATGKIRSRRQVGRTGCAPGAVQAAGRGVIVNEVGRDRVELTIVEAKGRIHTLRVPLKTPDRHCRKVGLAASATHAYVIADHAVAEIDPVTRHVKTTRVAGGGTVAAVVGGGVAMAGPAGLTVVDTPTFKPRWRDRSARWVEASGTKVVSTGGGTIKARDAKSGRLLWWTSGSAQAVAAGRVYTESAILDLATGEQVGTHPPFYSPIRFAEPPLGQTFGSG